MKKAVRILIYILIALVLLAVLLMAISPKNLKVKATESIHAPADVCYNLVNDLDRWMLWSPWVELDSTAAYDFSEKTEGVGARVHWKGNDNVGEGWQTITASSRPDSVVMSLEFKGWDGLSSTDFQFQKVEDNTLVTWTFEGADTPFLFRIFNLLNKSSLQKSHQKGLKNLKNIAENRANKKIYRGFEIKETELPEKHYVYNRKEVAMENIQQFYTQNLGALFGLVQKENLELDGMPSGLYFSWNEKLKRTDMAAAIPIKEDIELKDANTLNLPPGRAIQLDYYGDYSGLEKAHTAIDEYMNDYGLLPGSPVVEEYITDPGNQPDPSEWLTRISYYISSQ